MSAQAAGSSTGARTTADPVRHSRNRNLVLEALKTTGLLHKIRAQIRAGVAQEVLARSASGGSASTAAATDDRTRALDSLVFAHLVARGLELSASVFLAECGLVSENAVLGERGIAAVLGLREQLSGDGTLLDRIVVTAATSVTSRVSGTSSRAPEPARPVAEPEPSREEQIRPGSRTQSKASNLGFSRQNSVALQLLETAGVNVRDGASRNQEGTGLKATETLGRQRTSSTQSTQSIQSDTRHNLDLPPLPPLRPVSRSRRPKESNFEEQVGDLADSLEHELDRSRKLEKRLRKAEGEKEGWRAEVRRLRREVESLRRVVLEEEQLLPTKLKAAEPPMPPVPAPPPPLRSEPPSFGAHDDPRIDVTGIFDNIEAELYADQRYPAAGRDSVRSGAGSAYDNYGRGSVGSYAGSSSQHREPRRKVRERERDIRISSPEEDNHRQPIGGPREPTWDSKGGPSEEASLEIDPEIALLMEDIKRRDYDSRVRISDM